MGDIEADPDRSAGQQPATHRQLGIGQRIHQRQFVIVPVQAVFYVHVHFSFGSDPLIEHNMNR